MSSTGSGVEVIAQASFNHYCTYKQGCWMISLVIHF